MTWWARVLIVVAAVLDLVLGTHLTPTALAWGMTG